MSTSIRLADCFQRTQPWFRVFTCLALLGLVVGFGTAQEASDPITIGQRIKVESKVLNETRTVRISVPSDYDSKKLECGVVYLIDGESFFSTTTALTRHMNDAHLPLIVVGIENTKRTRDLTPPADASDPSEYAKDGGGSANFRRFLVDELRPFIEKNYRTTGMNLLAGHSFGGLFVFDTMLAEPDSFQAYFALSPSLWWNSRGLVTQLESIPTDHGLYDRYVFLAMGDEGKSMNVPFEEAVWVFKSKAPPSFRWDVKRFPGENHWSVAPPSIDSGLKCYFRWLRQASDATTASTIEDLEQEFAELGDIYGHLIPLRASAIWRLANRTASSGRVDDAVAMMKTAMKRFPDDLNLYRLLGRMLEEADRKADAIAIYEQGIAAASQVSDQPSWLVRSLQTKLDQLRPKSTTSEEKKD